MFGSAACDAGSKYAEPMEMAITPTYANGSSAGVRAKSGSRHAPARSRSTTIISLRRSSAVDGVSGDRRDQKNRQRLAEQHQRRQRGRAGELQHEIEQRDGQEPVAAERDQRPEVEQPEVAIRPQQAPHAARMLPLLGDGMLRRGDAVVGQERVGIVVLRVGFEVLAIGEPPFVDVVELGEVRVAARRRREPA